MMRALSLCFALLTWMSSASFGFGPGDGQPTQQLMRVSADGTWELYGVVTKCVPKTVQYEYVVKVPVNETKQVEVDGKLQQKQYTTYKEEKKTVTKTVMETYCEQISQRIDPQSVEAFEIDGRKIATDDLKKRLKKLTLVVMSGNNGMLPDYYAEVYKLGTIIIGKASPLSGPGGGPMAPIPPAGASPQPVPAPRAIPVPQPAAAPPAATLIEQIRTPVRPVTHHIAPDSAIDESPRLPTSPAPQLVFISREGADLVKVRQFTETQTVAKLIVRANDSSVSPQTEMALSRTTRHSETTPLQWKLLRFSTADAMDVPYDRVKERLGAGETTVLMSADGGLVDAFWLQNIQPRVLVVRGVQLPPTGGCAPVAMPAAQPFAPPGAPISAPPATPVPSIPNEKVPGPVQPTSEPKKS